MVVTMPPDLHGRLSDAAKNAGTTVNDYINKAVNYALTNAVAL